MIGQNLKKPFSYFLPDGIRASTLQNCVEPVLIHNIIGKFGNSETAIRINDNGKSVVWLERDDSLSFVKVSTFDYDSCTQSHVDVEMRDHDFQILSTDLKSRCLVDFKFDINKRHTEIKIFYQNFNDGVLHEVYTMSYTHLFNQYICEYFPEINKLVIITGDYKYGLKKYQYEKCDMYLDVLSCSFNDNGVVIESSDKRENITDQFNNEEVIEIIYSKLTNNIVLLTNQGGILMYSLVNHQFGILFRLQDIIFLSTFKNYIYVVTSSALAVVLSQDYASLELRIEKKVCLLPESPHTCRGLLHEASWIARDCLFVQNNMRMKIFELESLTLLHEFDYDLQAVQLFNGWSKEELFIIGSFVGDFPGNHHQLHIYYFRDKDISLKNLARKAILTSFSYNELKNIDMPNTLRIYLEV
ncbi:uncharacterized protein LOC130641226 isoform X1 [Hydractinia symbiolongicarpus]|uniref:uncharacterized protein LOC130641226 isoform X1 n=1 Tax=Hydractinia symbiolongicarpus TaxID=13093 RepID=UPI00254F0FB0|nr:uncharacterized protein LOC130641226 isoform X1 [Hydractinia symbiolongicarpus]